MRGRGVGRGGASTAEAARRHATALRLTYHGVTVYTMCTSSLATARSYRASADRARWPISTTPVPLRLAWTEWDGRAATWTACSRFQSFGPNSNVLGCSLTVWDRLEMYTRTGALGRAVSETPYTSEAMPGCMTTRWSNPGRLGLIRKAADVVPERGGVSQWLQ